MSERQGSIAIRLTGPGTWGDPADPDAAVAVLRRAVELGVDLIDTAEAYGPFTNEELIRRALHPYKGVVIATKGGGVRPGPGQWEACGRPGFIRQGVETSLRRLDVDCLDLYQLHRVDPLVPLADTLGVLRDLQDAGKIRNVGLSEVDVEDIEAVATRHWEHVLDHCERENVRAADVRLTDDQYEAITAAAGAGGISVVGVVP